MANDVHVCNMLYYVKKNLYVLRRGNTQKWVFFNFFSF